MLPSQLQIDNNNNNLILYNSLTYDDAMNKIILTFPIYYKIFQEYYMKGKNVSRELDRLYQPIFTSLLEYYSEFMTRGMEQIELTILNKYNPELPYAMIDYFEFIYGNILYETFLNEISKLDKSTLKYEHLCVFEYIIRVELYKHKLYLNTIKKIDSSSKILLAMEYRVEKCCKKIAFVHDYLLKNFSNQSSIIEYCKELIAESNLESKIISIDVSEISSFIQLNKQIN